MIKRGFTLIELIIVIAVISILAGAIFVAVDPARRLHETRNARRWSDVTTILDAIKKYQADNEGEHYSEVDSLTNDFVYTIGTEKGAVCEISCGDETPDVNCVDLSGMGTNYLAIVPVDPKDGTAAITQYAIEKDSNGAITVYSCSAEGEGAGGSGEAPDIRVTR